MIDRVTVQNCRDAGYCVKGVKAHCQLLGLNFKVLVREGLLISEIEHLDDAIVQRCIRTARAEGKNDE
jgi:hypothetical protein